MVWKLFDRSSLKNILGGVNVESLDPFDRLYFKVFYASQRPIGFHFQECHKRDLNQRRKILLKGNCMLALKPEAAHRSNGVLICVGALGF